MYANRHPDATKGHSPFGKYLLHCEYLRIGRKWHRSENYVHRLVWERDCVEAMRQGVFDFLQKPFRNQDLLDRVQKALAKDRARRAELRGDESIRLAV